MFFNKLIILFLFFLVSCSGFQTKYPENSDLYWSQLVTLSEKKQISILEVLKKENPHLYRQIEEDSKDSELLSFWGKSTNFDSGAKKQIISDAIISDLHHQFHLETDRKIVHAGITHSYGYLFSIINTPYGFKRKRWIAPTLNYGFAFSGNALSPETVQGTLLSNLTFFAGKIAFKSESDKEKLNALKNVSSEIRNFDYSKLEVKLVEEEISQSDFTLRTSLVKLPFKQATEENDYLLIYSIWNQKEGREILITAFPINKSAFAKIVDQKEMGKNQNIAVRYNAYLEGFMDYKIVGDRKIH